MPRTRSFISSEFDRDLAMVLIGSVQGRSRYQGDLCRRSPTLFFAVPQEIADLQAVPAGIGANGDHLLAGFFEATRTGSDLTVVGPSFMRWLLDTEALCRPGGPAPLLAYLASARDFTTRRIYGDWPDNAAGIAQGKTLFAATQDPGLRECLMIGVAAFLRAPAMAAKLIVDHEGRASGDQQRAQHRLVGQLTAMLGAAL